MDGLPAGAAVHPRDGHTIIQLPTADQQALHAVLAGLHARAVPVLGVSRVRPSLEEVFVQLVRAR